MNEVLARKNRNRAEKVYNESAVQTTYALVRIKNGDAVLEDVIIEGRSILDIVKERMSNEEGK